VHHVKHSVTMTTLTTKQRSAFLLSRSRASKGPKNPIKIPFIYFSFIIKGESRTDSLVGSLVGSTLKISSRRTLGPGTSGLHL
jgi:hypothetical protein